MDVTTFACERRWRVKNRCFQAIGPKEHLLLAEGMRCLWSHNDQENTRLGHYCLPKAAKKLKVVYCRPVQLAAFKKTFVSGIWLN